MISAIITVVLYYLAIKWFFKWIGESIVTIIEVVSNFKKS